MENTFEYTGNRNNVQVISEMTGPFLGNLKAGSRAYKVNQESMNIGMKNNVSSNDILITKETNRNDVINKVLSFGEGHFIIETKRGERVAKIIGLTSDHEMAICQDPNSDSIDSEYMMSFSSMKSIRDIQDVIFKDK